MRRSRSAGAGFSLAEVLLSVALLAVLFAALSAALAGMARLYRAEVAALELLAQARFAAQSVMRDISYAQRVKMGEERIEIFTRRNSASLRKIVYALDQNSKGRRLLKDGQPVTGDSRSARVSFTALRFAPCGARGVCIELTAVDLEGGRTFSLQTAARMENGQEDADADG